MAKQPLSPVEKRFRFERRAEFVDGKGVRIEHCRWADLPEHDPTVSQANVENKGGQVVFYMPVDGR